MANLRKLGRRADHRNANLRNQVQSLFENSKIETTLTRAKETRRVAEKMTLLLKKEIFTQEDKSIGLYLQDGNSS